MPVDPADELRAALTDLQTAVDNAAFSASALLAAARAPAELDVELLAEAIRRVPVAVMGASQTYANEAAAAIAREYAALAAAKDEPHD